MTRPLALTLGEPAGIGPDITFAAWQRRAELALPPFYLLAEPGHTEYLARLAQEQTGRAAHPVMMLWSPELAVVPVTIHLPVRDVPRQLTTALILDTGRIVARDLSARFGIARPRLALTGL